VIAAAVAVFPLKNDDHYEVGIRFDYMQQHTGQHILSYAFAELFAGNTVGFHLSESYTIIDSARNILVLCNGR